MKGLSMKRFFTFPAAVLAGTLALAGTTAGTAWAKDKPCSKETLEGTYGLSGGGTSLGFGQEVDSGIFTADGKGSAKGSVTTVSIGGTIVPVPLSARLSFTVTYNVNSDCTATVTINVDPPNPPPPIHGVGVIFDGGNEFRFIQVDLGSAIAFVARRVNHPGSWQVAAGLDFVDEGVDGCIDLLLRARPSLCGGG
jgi:hypothetical protein